MAYNLSEKLSGPFQSFPFNDPGAYHFEKVKLKHNVVPFLSNVPRKTGEGSILWTQATYDVAASHRVPNITSFKSKQKRFTYETFNDEDLKEILCKCGVDTSCVCPGKNEALKELVCQGKIKRRLFKGRGTKGILGDEGLSAPSKNDYGFSIDPSGFQKRLRIEIRKSSSIFYNANTTEFSTYYRGCKWSQRTSKRIQKSSEVSPGPTTYYLSKKPTEDKIFIEKLRSYKRKISKQPRFIEMVQQQNIRDRRPGPGSYNLTRPQETDLKVMGTEAQRFPSSKNKQYPGPAEYWVRRDFDPVNPPKIHCRAYLPAPAPFGVKSQRFKQQHTIEPSSASYNVSHKLCQYIHCSTAPFGSSALRFEPNTIDDNDEETFIDKHETDKRDSSCPQTMWFFKSKTVRMKSLIKDINKHSPADMSPKENKWERSPQLQYALPFYSSEGRFNPWYNWIPVHGKLKTPSPCDYNPTKSLCTSAFKHGPLYRSKRFPMNSFVTPAPNAYKVSNGIEIILKTHNKHLLNNIEKKHISSWNPPIEKQVLTYKQREALLFQKCIRLLEPTENFKDNSKPGANNLANLSSFLVKTHRKQEAINLICVSNKDTATVEGKTIVGGNKKLKLLRSFLYSHQIPSYF